MDQADSAGAACEVAEAAQALELCGPADASQQVAGNNEANTFVERVSLCESRCSCLLP